MIRAALGIADPAFPVEVLSVRSWAMSAQVLPRRPGTCEFIGHDRMSLFDWQLAMPRRQGRFHLLLPQEHPCFADHLLAGVDIFVQGVC